MTKGGERGARRVSASECGGCGVYIVGDGEEICGRM